jgi:glutamate-1-semialdehyde 2,1-aminomutase
VAVAAALRTIEYLKENEQTIYPHLEALGGRMETGITEIFARRGVRGCVARQGSAFSFYFMDRAPRDLHDIIEGHDFPKDLALRRALIERGSFFIPIATKQCSISAAHTAEDIDQTLQAFDDALAAL